MTTPFSINFSIDPKGAFVDYGPLENKPKYVSYVKILFELVRRSRDNGKFADNQRFYVFSENPARTRAEVLNGFLPLADQIIFLGTDLPDLLFCLSKLNETSHLLVLGGAPLEFDPRAWHFSALLRLIKPDYQQRMEEIFREPVFDFLPKKQDKSFYLETRPGKIESLNLLAKVQKSSIKRKSMIEELLKKNLDRDSFLECAPIIKGWGIGYLSCSEKKEMAPWQTIKMTRASRHFCLAEDDLSLKRDLSDFFDEFFTNSGSTMKFPESIVIFTPCYEISLFIAECLSEVRQEERIFQRISYPNFHFGWHPAIQFLGGICSEKSRMLFILMNDFASIEVILCEKSLAY